MAVLGIDTSNYASSVSIIKGDGGLIYKKELLPVKQGSLGLMQSEAVFHHTKQMPELIEEAFSGLQEKISAIGVSTRPRAVEGSYMPCFAVGEGLARAVGAALHVPIFAFSHQQGHIAAAIYSCGCSELYKKRFIAFHVSGGTTEALLVTPSNSDILNIKIIASSRDLKAGQAVDRVGVMLGLPFPAGRYLDELACECTEKIAVRPTLKGSDCCLSGVQNICELLHKQGKPDAYVARYCIEYISSTIDGMTEALLREYGDLPLLFAGGVMSNSMISARLGSKYGAYFAEPKFSGDNATGVACLAAMSLEKPNI